jgi:GAF domain-containing protein
MGGQFVPNYETKIDGTPCQRVIEEETLVHYPDRVVDLFPDDPDVQRNAVVSYLGVPLKDLDGTILGHLAVMDRRPMPEDPRALALFQIFAARAGAALRRLRAERECGSARRSWRGSWTAPWTRSSNSTRTGT